MTLPMVCYCTWNRAGIAASSLTALLDSTDDFELYIIDNNSQDDTWKFIQGLRDDRIKEKKRFDINRGVIYAANYALHKRKKDQFFIWVQNDVCIKTKDFVTQFMKTMDTFPDVGLLSLWGLTPDRYFQHKKIWPELIQKNSLSYYKYFIANGSCNCIRPEVFDCIGYFNEETYGFDNDLCNRIHNFTNYNVGYATNIAFDNLQTISCDQCILKDTCSLLEKSATCFNIWRSKHRHVLFTREMAHKHIEYLKDINSGSRSIYCASIHDPDSIINNYYNREWAEENFQYFIKNSN